MEMNTGWWNRHFVALVWLMIIVSSAVFWSALAGGVVAVWVK